MVYPSAVTPLTGLTFVAFDTETTGLSPIGAHLVELSGVKFSIDGQVLSTFSQLIDPDSKIPEEATAIHGITDEMVCGQPKYSTVIPSFLQWLGHGEVVLVAHNASFDLGFLEVALAKLNAPPPEHLVIDTLSLSRRLIPEAVNHQLHTLVEHLGLSSGGYHRALADSYHVKDLFVRLLDILSDVSTWKELSDICAPISFNNLQEDAREQLKTMPAGFEFITQAIDEHLRISLTYQGGQVARRIVTPQAVHGWRGRYYLSAYCHTVKAERTFRLDRIVSFRLLDKSIAN
ncbi:MAG: WYL domain-containing protein [Candidatus Melainabacteria bacterium]|nr:WYL domain-containing protein [Candidatus Melainabacteria bacterium]